MHKTSAKHCIGQRFIFDPYDNSLIDTVENNELIRLGSNESRALSLLIDDQERSLHVIDCMIMYSANKVLRLMIPA